MSRKATTLGVLSLAVAVLLLVVLVHANSSISNKRNERNESVSIDPVARNSNASFQTQGNNTRDITNSRNLSMQPEAIRLLRRVGGWRFRSKTPPAVVMHGVLTTGSGRQDVQMARYQEDSGERVELVLGSGTKLLSWDASVGAASSRGTVALTDRTILERLIFDTADQFVLAQIRGASYQTVIRNVRPDDAPENYAGPLWDVVRIDDPELDEQKRPLSRWRLYYLNRTTGLIDKIVSDTQGERVEAALSDWNERDGETFPFTFTWTSRGQTLMTLTVTNVSFVAQ